LAPFASGKEQVIKILKEVKVTKAKKYGRKENNQRRLIWCKLALLAPTTSLELL
jgi:hypothetical protein